MLINYMRIALRVIKHDTWHFMLNLFGFSIGLAAAIIVGLFAAYEWSYDNQHPNGERVYRVHTDYRAWGLQMIAHSDSRLSLEMLNHTQVEDVLILSQMKDLGYFSEPLAMEVVINGEQARLSNAYVASANIGDFIQLDVLSGDLDKALTEPGKLAISRSESIRFFGTENALEKTLSYDGGRYVIAAVFADLPDNTHFVFDTLTGIPKVLSRPIRGYVYMRLDQSADPRVIAEQITTNMREKSTGRGKKLSITLNSLQDLHFHSNGPFEMKQGSSKLVMQVSIALTFLLLLIASVNFINLNIASAAKRAKEVGVRKALGASKSQLITQFLIESLFVVTLAVVIALFLVELSIPYVNALLERSLSLSFSSLFLALVISVTLLIGVLAGLYPALFIASFSAKRVLSGDLQRGKTAIWVRKLTLALQGGLSVALIVAAVVIYKQMALIDSLPVGYSKLDRIIIKDLPTEAVFQMEGSHLLAQLEQIEGVEHVLPSNTILTEDITAELFFTWPNGEQLRGTQPTISTGFNPVETLGLELVAGRDFSSDYISDWAVTNDQGERTFSVLISEGLAKQAGYSDPTTLLGKTLSANDGNSRAKVVGIIKDIKIGSARQQQLPLSINAAAIDNSPESHVVIKVGPGANKVRIMEQAQRFISTELAVSDVKINLIEDDYRHAHINEYRIQQLVLLFSGLAILLTCLGILGLASFSAIRRQKEIAIRKVLGSSRLSIVNLLSKEFLVIVLCGGGVACPVSYILMSDWLANFNERIELALWIYGVAAISVIGITWLTVASLALRAASTRPSLILRYE
ncbi:hypothetical protein PCIT_a3842 [Pseudoalteromonas citrea]|uniref:ABC transporter permease n=2 Tax=Pseudoalteromonas citrea TaxID=43655 RepID=A0AAD4AGC2_9GAMM|nr:ABC transporter permease [Pseudoalteromonas citrea]KAF7767754.1 hypothetical protein PCIT_a3842 [Pseudoalteromonas citrea]